jgi:hypothetical protein
MISFSKTIISSFLVAWICGFTLQAANAQLIESERRQEYHRRNYTWPLPLESYKPPVEGWKNLMEHRLRQVAEIDNDGDRYEGYIQTMNAAIVAPNFTRKFVFVCF